MKLRFPQTAVAVSMLSLTACELSPEGQEAQEPQQEVARSAQLLRSLDAVPNEYIVVFHDSVSPRAVEALARDMAAQHGGNVMFTYESAIKGFAVRMPEARVQALLRNPHVKYVEENAQVRASASQTGATWGIDRTDQRALPLNQTYNYSADGTGVHTYIVDTGVKLDHVEFTGRMGNGYDAVTAGGTANDCNGHGSHVAGTTAGTTYGLAKKAVVHPVRVLDCNGSGTTAGVIAGVDWVRTNHIKPAVANMSLGGGASQTLDDAVNNAVGAGVTFAVAAGNDNANACNYSPARAASALTVGSTTNTDARSSFSNYGTCLDIFAPGSSITSAWHTSSTATNTISGTSMASPHVAGVAALFLGCNTTATPAQVEAALEGNATSGVVTSAGTGSPNLLLYSNFISCTGTPGDTTAPTTSITDPTTGTTLTGTVTVSANASDDVGVTKVDFFAGSTLIGSDTTSPFSISWNSAGVTNGTYSITSKAYDASGNMGTSAGVSVTVSNADTTPALTDGVAVTGLGDATGAQKFYKLTVPTGQTSLKFTISGGTGDADLYVKFGTKPTTSSYDCRPYKSGNAEECVFTNPAAGDWYVMLHAYSTYSGVSLVGDYSNGPVGNALTNGVATAAYSGASASWTCWTLNVPAGVSSVAFNQAGVSGNTGDADLYVRFGAAPTTSTYNCRPYLSGNSETCTISAPSSGTWYACSYGYSAYSGVTMKGTY